MDVMTKSLECYETCVDEMVEKLSEDDRIALYKALAIVVNDVKTRSNEHGNVKTIPLSARAVLMTLVSAMYFDKFKESPVTTKLKSYSKR